MHHNTRQFTWPCNCVAQVRLSVQLAHGYAPSSGPGLMAMHVPMPEPAYQCIYMCHKERTCASSDSRCLKNAYSRQCAWCAWHCACVCNILHGSGWCHVHKHICLCPKLHDIASVYAHVNVTTRIALRKSMQESCIVTDVHEVRNSEIYTCDSKDSAPRNQLL